MTGTDSRNNLTKTGENDGDEAANYFQSPTGKNWKTTPITDLRDE